MADTLPASNPTKLLFRQLEALTGFATTFRYSTPGGKLKDGLTDKDFSTFADKVEAIISMLTEWFEVDANMKSKDPAMKTTPIRAE